MCVKINSYVFRLVGNRCNLKCKYCYYDEHHSEQMSINDIRKVLTSMSKYAEICNDNHVIITWHGGEPMLFGLDGYKEIVAIQKQLYPINFVNKMQTNATLITDEWCNFFKENNFKVGISFDIDEDVHNHNRDNSYDKVIQSIKLMREYDLPISTLTVCSFALLEKNPVYLLDKIIDLGVKNFDFKPFYNKGIDIEQYNHKYCNFIIKLFEYFLKIDNPNLHFRLLYSTIDKILGAPQGGLCVFNKECGVFPSINYDGNIYACDNYDDMNLPSYIGNILSDDIYDIFNSEHYKKVKNRFNAFKTRTKCLDCEVFDLCHGGCPNTSDININDMLYCSAYKSIFKYVDNIVKNNMKYIQ